MQYNSTFIKYTAKLLLLYFIFDYGTTLFIGVTGTGGRYYSYTLDHYFNYVSWLRNIILHGSNSMMHLLRFDTTIVSEYLIGIKHGAAVQLVYSCLGYGVLSFWAAFIIANKGTLKFKAIWLCFGFFVIIFSNIVRVCILLISKQQKWYKPFEFDHHTTYNIIAYLLVLMLMFFFLKVLKQKSASA